MAKPIPDHAQKLIALTLFAIGVLYLGLFMGQVARYIDYPLPGQKWAGYGIALIIVLVAPQLRVTRQKTNIVLLLLAIAVILTSCVM
jgi:hypothetical protein